MSIGFIPSIVISILLFNVNNVLPQQQDISLPQSLNKVLRRERISWCCTSQLEKKKCQDWARAIEDVNIQYEGQEPFELNLDCVLASDKDQCMVMVDEELADLVLLDPGELSVAGRHHSLTPIVSERYKSSMTDMGKYSVAVVKKRDQTIQSLTDLFKKRACFSSVSHMASWTLPVSTLIDLPLFKIEDCNNIVKSVSHYFGDSCAPNAMINKFNPTGDNPQTITKLCDLPHSKVGSHYESYAGSLSALKCLKDININQPLSGYQIDSSSFNIRGGDVAFVPISAVLLSEKLNLTREARSEVPTKNELELLCPQGGRQPIERWQNCNFGFAPASAIVVSSQKTQEMRTKIQKFLKTSVLLFGSTISLQTNVRAHDSIIDSPRKPPNQQQHTQETFQQQQLLPIAFESRSFNQISRDGQSAVSSYNVHLAKPIQSQFKLFGDTALFNYPGLDVLFSSDMIDLVPLLGAQQTLKGYLNSFPVQPATTQSISNNIRQSTSSPSTSFFNYFTSNVNSNQDDSLFQFKISTQTDYFDKIRRCPASSVIMCVTSDKEFVKCQAMSKAFHAARLKPDLNCKLAPSTLACMQLIQNRDADLTVLDPADIYIAGKKFNLIPILSEEIELHGTKNYVVAVAKKSNGNIDLYSLQAKRSCHSGFFKAAGWVMPINFLLGSNKIRSNDEYECNTVRAAAEHFDKACAPGIMFATPVSNKLWSHTEWTVRNMCELCHGSGRNYCARDASEPFFGDTGAFRCLVEGGGDVAFLKYTALYQNTGGSNDETWARNLIRPDFELLCRDGNRASVDDYEQCNLGLVPNNAIVTRDDSPISLIDAYVNLFLYGQQQYGSKYSEEYTFKMFTSTNGRDLIFQDSTQLLVKIPFFNQTYNNYLDKAFLEAMESVYCIQ